MDVFTTVLIQPLANGLILFYKLLGANMGLAIIGFSLFLRVLLNPLTKPYMDSMKKMKAYSKQIEKLKHRHRNDKKKQMEAQAAFYKQKGINPGSGCLPYLLQIVVLIALFNVFSRVLASDADVVGKFNELLYEPLKFEQSAVINTKFLYLNITKPDVIRVASLPVPIPGPFLIVAAIMQLINAKIMAPYVEQEKKIAKKTPGEADDFAASLQQSTIYMFPIMTIIFGINFPSGLALYWLLFSLFQLVTQYRSSGWGGATPWIRRLGLLK